MKQEILTQLRSAEDDTARRIEAAKGRAAEIGKQAQHQRVDLLRAAEDEARKAQTEEIARERALLAQTRERILAEGRGQEEKLRSQYGARQAQYVRKALDAFTGSLNA